MLTIIIETTNKSVETPEDQVVTTITNGTGAHISSEGST